MSYSDFVSFLKLLLTTKIITIIINNKGTSGGSAFFFLEIDGHFTTAHGTIVLH